MGRLDQFELPPAKIKIDVDKIEIEASGGYEGSFFVRNAGGSTLEGKISSGSRSITFSPAEFSGNSVEISYTFVPDFYKQGDEIHTSALIMSNGGEAVIPISVKIVPPEIKAKDGQVVASLADFCGFARTSPVLARQMFTQWDFSLWLSSMGYKNMELYEHFTEDPNRERAVDNFLVLNGLKEKSRVSINSKQISLAVNYGSGEAITDALSFERSDWGYVDVQLRVSRGDSWLKLSKDRLTSADFNEDNYAELYFMVLPEFLGKRFESAYIEVESESETIGGICIEVKKKQGIDVALDRPSYGSDDEGFLDIINNTGKDLVVELTAKDSFVKLEAKRCFVGEHARVGFGIKMPQFSFKKQLLTKTEIFVRVISDELTYQRAVGLSIGGF